MSSSILNKSYIYSIDSGTYLVKTNSTIKLSPSSYSHVALSTSHYAASKNSTLYISSLVSNHSAQLSLPLVISSIQWCSLLLVVSTLDKTYIISKDGGILRDFIPGIIASNSFLWPSLFIWNNNSLNVCILPYLSHLDQEKLPDLRDGSYWTDQLINHHEQQLEQHKGISYPLKGTLSTLFTSLINVESELENVLHMATKSNETFMFLFSLSPNSVSISVIEYLDPIWPNKTFDIPKLYTLSKISIPIENGRLRVDPQYDRIYAFNETSVFMIDFQNILKNQKPTLEWIVDVTDL